MTFLLDVNVLIALLDPDHASHGLASRWFEQIGQASWATCPIVENGVIRIVGGASYSSVPISCSAVAETLARWCSREGHEFWPDDLSLLTDSSVDRSKLLSPSRITDAYLLALAARHGGRLATLDRRLSSDMVAGGQQYLHLIV